MPKIGKLALFAVVPLCLAAGVFYGLAKLKVIPVDKLAKKNPILRMAFKAMGIKTKVEKPKAVAAKDAPDPLAAQKKQIADQQAALEKDRNDFELQKEAQARAKAQGQPQPNTPAPLNLDPKNVARMASVYEQMPPDTVNKIFSKMPGEQVIALLRRMDEKQVGDILALMTPERAASFTLALSKPAPPDRTASATNP